MYVRWKGGRTERDRMGVGGDERGSVTVTVLCDVQVFVSGRDGPCRDGGGRGGRGYGDGGALSLVVTMLRNLEASKVHAEVRTG